MGRDGNQDQEDRHHRVDRPGPLLDPGHARRQRRLGDSLRRPVLVLPLGHGGMVAPAVGRRPFERPSARIAFKVDKLETCLYESRMSNNQDVQEILRKVASGELSPEEAAAQIEALHRTQIAVTEVPIRKVRVVGALHPLRITGDGEVREAVVSGMHEASRQGDTLLVRTTGPGDEESGFAFRWAGWPGKPNFGSGEPVQRALRPIQIRMNPALALEVEMAAGLLSVHGVKGPIKAEIQAGSAKLEGFASPFDLKVTWGTVSATGVLDRGRSQVRCEAGTVKIGLEKGSSVKVAARSTLGRISLPGESSGISDGWTMGGEEREATVGSGAGQLDVETTTGAVWVDEVKE